MVRAQELRHAWERFVEELFLHGVEEEARGRAGEPIADSWRRSFAAGVDPTGHRLAPGVADEGETQSRWEGHPLAGAAPLIRDCLGAIAFEAEYLIVVSDAEGMLLSIEGSPGVRLRAADSMDFTEGTLWSEPGAGTNAIGTAIAADHAVQVFGPEHFNEVVQRWTCSAAPIHDPDTGEPIGVIDLTGDVSTVHPASLAVAMATARAVETSLVLQLQERDTRLRARYGERVRVARGSSLLVSPTGRPITRPPEGWGVMGRLSIPEGGGAVALPSGASAIAEPVDRAGEVYLVRAPRRLPAQPATATPEVRLAVLGRDRAVLEAGGRRIQVRPRLPRRPPASLRPSRGAERRVAVRAPARRRRQPELRARRGLAAAQGARPGGARHRPLPADLRARVRRAARREPAPARARPRGGRGLHRPAAPGLRGAGGGRGARAAGVLAAPGGDDCRRRRGAVGVGAHRSRDRGPPRVEA